MGLWGTGRAFGCLRDICGPVEGLWDPVGPLGARGTFEDHGRAFGAVGGRWRAFGCLGDFWGPVEGLWDPVGPLGARWAFGGPGDGLWGSGWAFGGAGGPLGAWGAFEDRGLPSGLG